MSEPRTPSSGDRSGADTGLLLDEQAVPGAGGRGESDAIAHAAAPGHGADGAAEYEVTSRGAISWMNDLHKGRHTGTAWSWFIDIFAVACIVFCITGFLIMKMHAANRRATWPVIGFGILLPLLLALLFIH